MNDPTGTSAWFFPFPPDYFTVLTGYWGINHFRLSPFMPEVVYVLFNRDLNLLVRIHEMRKQKIIVLEEKKERWIKRRGEPW